MHNLIDPSASLKCSPLISEAIKERDKPVVIQVDQWADASILAKLVREAKKASPSVSLATLKTK